VVRKSWRWHRSTAGLLRYDWRLRELHRLQLSVQSEGRIRDPVLVSAAVEERHWVLVDGFKRLRVAEELGLTHIWAQVVQLDACQAKAAILQWNQARHGLSEIEEAWIVHSLCRDQGLKQAQVALLLKRDKSWVCRRLKLVEDLDASLQEDTRLGLLSVSAARELAKLPRGNQLQVARAIREHGLSVRQSVLLTQRLQQVGDPHAARAVLDDPLRYLAAESGTQRLADRDPRLGEDGNRLRRLLMGWQGHCGQLMRELRRHGAVVEDEVMIEVLQDALSAGKKVLRQLEARSARSLPPPHGERASTEASPHA
jgi:ParB/RepB/Spo0J family partition protein